MRGLGLRPGARAVIDRRLRADLAAGRMHDRDQARRSTSHGLYRADRRPCRRRQLPLLILIDPDKPEERRGAKALHGPLVARALAMDGTCTGEHGIGLGKIDYLTDELGEAVDVMRSIKTALDPDGLMNPGKIFASGARA